MQQPRRAQHVLSLKGEPPPLIQPLFDHRKILDSTIEDSRGLARKGDSQMHLQVDSGLVVEPARLTLRNLTTMRLKNYTRKYILMRIID